MLATPPPRHPQGDPNAHALLPGAPSQLVLLDLAVLVLDRTPMPSTLMYSVAFSHFLSAIAA